MKKQENKKIYTGGPSTSTKDSHEVKPPPLRTQLLGFAKSFTGWIAEGAKIVTPKDTWEG